MCLANWSQLMLEAFHVSYLSSSLGFCDVLMKIEIFFRVQLSNSFDWKPRHLAIMLPCFHKSFQIVFVCFIHSRYHKCFDSHKKIKNHLISDLCDLRLDLLFKLFFCFICLKFIHFHNWRMVTDFKFLFSLIYHLTDSFIHWSN